MTERVAFNPTRAQFHYSRAVRVGDLLFIAGHVAREDGTGDVPPVGIGEQTAMILEQFKQAVESAGSSLDRIVKVNVFIVNKEDFSEFNSAYARFFPKDPPVRTTVQTNLLPPNALIEMDAIATV